MTLFSPLPELRFAHPEPQAGPGRIFPIFLPFAGCPRRCLYCAQDLQTGQEPGAVPQVLKTARDAFDKLTNIPDELAFYGGTFTALPEADLDLCLAFARELLAGGRIQRFRCSTRPDAVTPVLLRRLKDHGCTGVELGVQSFSEAALAASSRGYGRSQALEACAMVKEAGLFLGIQLMPGLPGAPAGEAVDIALEDAAQAARLKPAWARLYPCLVFVDSPLERLWRAGDYLPLALLETVDLLARSCLLLWSAGARVIRMGLAEPERLRPLVLTGPLHPALGNLARIRAVFLLAEAHAEAYRKIYAGPSVLSVPRARQGEAYPPREPPIAPYADLGICKVRLHADDDFVLSPGLMPAPA